MVERGRQGKRSICQIVNLHLVQQQNDCPILYRISPKYSGITLVLTLKEGRLQGIPNYTNLSFASSCSYGKLDNCVFKKKKNRRVHLSLLTFAYFPRFLVVTVESNFSCSPALPLTPLTSRVVELLTSTMKWKCAASLLTASRSLVRRNETTHSIV